MLKRFFDIIISGVALLILSPLLLLVMLLIWLQDFHHPFYIAPRMGLGDRSFRMIKFRSMVVNADKTGVDSTKSDDRRITWVGRFVRRWKVDEISQLWNVLWGQMSLVGPRPNVERETQLYTSEEKKLLLVRPGITDIASIVFSDEGEILAGAEDPDLRYNQIIRPWKSRLGLLYVRNQSLWLDTRIIFLTVLAIASRRLALQRLQGILTGLKCDILTSKMASRKDTLIPYAPPGATQIVQDRNAPPQ